MMNQILIGLLGILSGLGASPIAEPKPTPPELTFPTTALISVPAWFCGWTERERPYAYVGFAFQIDGRVHYFRTATNCKDFPASPFPWPAHDPFNMTMFGEQVTLDDATHPRWVRRENGVVYPIEPSDRSTTNSYFVPTVVLSSDDNLKYRSNPHPDLALQECRRLTDKVERDLCLFYQAGHQQDRALCAELSEEKSAVCIRLLENLSKRQVNQ